MKARATTQWRSLLATLTTLAVPACRPDSTAVMQRTTGVPARIVELESRRFPRWQAVLLHEGDATEAPPLAGDVVAVFVEDTVLAVASGSRINLHDADGRFRRPLTREGQGPGEFRAIGSLGLAGDGTVFASDLFSGRFARMRTDGSVVQFIARLQVPGESREVQPLASLPDGSLLATLWQWRPNRGRLPGILRGGAERDPVPVLRLSKHGTIEDTIGQWEGLERYVAMVEGDEARLPLALARSAVHDAHGEVAVVGITDSLDLTIVVDGAPLHRLVAAARRRPVPAAAVESWRQGVRDALGPLADEVLRSKSQSQASFVPDVGGVLVDDRGRIWIGEYALPQEAYRRWWCLSQEGAPLGTLVIPALHRPMMPSSTELLDVRGDRMAVLAGTDSGAVSLQVWSIRHETMAQP